MAHTSDHDGPLPALLLVLTVVTGIVDAVSYLRLGHVFVANMTGNVALLGFALADAEDFSVASSLAALFAFVVGAVVGGRLGSDIEVHRGRFVAWALLIEVGLVTGALITSTTFSTVDTDGVRYTLIVLLALAMGLQTAVARRIGVLDINTTVLTLTLAGLAADSSVAGGHNARWGRRALSIGAMLVGAAIGAALLLNVGLSAALALALTLLVSGAITGYRWVASTQPWTLDQSRRP